MADIENFRADPIFDPPSRYAGMGLTPAPQAASPMDGPEATRLHGKLMNGFLYEKRRQAMNRYQMAIDHDFYDSIQLTDEELAELTERGQPLYVYNLVKRAADWVIGTEKRTRIDFKVLGRGKDEAEVEAARNKTDLMKYLSDVNKTPFARSQAFKEAVISGLGWLECGVRGQSDEEPVYSTNESWRNTLHDSHSLKLDYTDAMYHYRYKYADLDVAVAMFPERERQIEQAVVSGIQADDELMDEFYLGNRLTGEDYLVGRNGQQLSTGFTGFLDNSRDRVRLIEGWFKRPVRDQVMVSKAVPSMHGERFNQNNDDHRHAVLIGDASIVERVRLAVFYAMMTEGHMLAMGRSPYRHNQFPFTPLWCYRRGRDNAPYGFIRPIRDPQTGFNARMRKALFALSAYRVEATSNAIDPKTQNWDEIRTEAGRPDGMLVRAPNSELKVVQDRAMAEGHMKLAEMDASLILDSSGITADNLGMDSNAQSGKAIIAKQSEGSAVTAEVFDNARFAYQIHGEKELSVSEQYVSDERVIRITDAKGRPTYKKLNEVVQLEDGTVRVLNDITATKADFIIDQADFNVSLREAASQKLFDFAGKMAQSMDPMIVLQILDMAIDQSNLPDKGEMLKRIRAISGYQAPEDALTPQEQQQAQQAQAQKEQQAKAQADQQAAAADAETKAKLAETELKLAQADKARAEAERARNELADKSTVLTPEQQARIEELNAAHEKALGDIADHQQTIATLKQQAVDRSAEITATNEAAKYKADQERAAAEHAATQQSAAAIHAANKQHEATVAAAQAEHGKPVDPAHEETIADFQQTVVEMSRAMEALQKQVADGEKAGEKEKKDLLAAVEKTIEKAVAAVKPAEASAPAPAAPASHTINLSIQVDAKGKPVARTITLPNGGTARITPDEEPQPKPKK